jgi:hypothetical protein
MFTFKTISDLKLFQKKLNLKIFILKNVQKSKCSDLKNKRSKKEKVNQ